MASRRGAQVAAGRLPVAQVAVDVSLPHLDRPFDYLVPERLDQDAVPGCRVRVRFAGRLTGGYLLGRAETSQHQGGLAFLERVVSPEPVLTPEIAGLARAVADRYGGTLADVLRLAIPPRHAAAEPAARTAVPRRAARRSRRSPGRGTATRRAGRSLPRWPRGRAPRAAWSALPGPHWPEEIARAAATARAAGRGALIVVPDARDLGLVDAALGDLLGPGPARLPRGRPRPRGAVPALAHRRPGRRSGWWPGPGQRCSPRSPTSAWS